MPKASEQANHRHAEGAGFGHGPVALDDSGPERLRQIAVGLVDAIRLDNPELADVVSDTVRDDLGEAWGVYLNAGSLGLTAEEADAWLRIAAASGRREAVDLLSRKGRAKVVPRRRMSGSLPVTEPVPAAVSDIPACLPGRMVIARVGDPDSREGRELSTRYSPVVGKVLPFAGRLPPPGRLRASLMARWPWAEGVAAELEAQMAVLRRGSGDEVKVPPVLLVGPPGCGKTSLALALADMLVLPRTLVPSGGTSDAGGLSAFTRGWATSRPAAVTQAFLEHGASNPVIVVDELDKSSRVGAQNGSVQATLLAMVGKGGAHWQDACLCTPVDLRSVSWLATANDIGTVDPALAERFLVLRMEGPRPRDFDVLLSAAASDFAVENGLRIAEVPDVGGPGRALLRRVLAKRRSARAFAEAFDRLARAAAAGEEQVGAGEAAWLN